MRIALVTEYYYPHLGGVCEHVHFFAAEARRQGHDVQIITSRIAGASPEPDVVRLGTSVPIYINGSYGRFTVGRALRRDLRHVLRDGCYDIVHVHSPLTPVLPLLAIEEAEVPVVGTFHTYFDRSAGYHTFRRYFQQRLEMLSAAIAVSRSTVAALERYFEADWRIIPNGVDTSLFHPDAPRPPELPDDAPAILFLGRFDPRNGLSTLIDAFKKVKRRGRSARLVIVGDGPLRGYYARRAAGDPDIKFVGAVLDDRAGYYAHSAIYACPTTKASFGITLLESMACHTAIVCSDIPGFRDVVAHGREAMMVPCRDSSALADALVALLDDEGSRARLAANGHARAALYDWKRVSADVLEIYDGILLPPRLAVAV